MCLWLVEQAKNGFQCIVLLLESVDGTERQRDTWHRQRISVDPKYYYADLNAAHCLHARPLRALQDPSCFLLVHPQERQAPCAERTCLSWMQ